MEQATAPDGRGSASCWREADVWRVRAARLGPLRHSDLGERWLAQPGPVDVLASWLVEAIDGWWGRAGRPDPYVVSVASGDDGTLARAVLELGPECLTALRYVIVDPEAHTVPGQERTRRATGLLGLEDPAFLFPSKIRPLDPELDHEETFDPDEAHPLARGVGPLVTTLSGLPVITDTARFGGDGPAGVIVAVELLSRLAYDLVELGEDGRWSEVRLAFAADSGRREEVVVPLGPERIDALPDALARGLAPGRYAVEIGAVQWLRSVLGSTPASVVAVVDRWAPSGAAPQTGEPPALAFDQLRRVHEPVESEPAGLDQGIAVVTWRA